MSGPKTSRYTLTPEQRRILAEQRRIQVLKVRIEQQKGDIRSVVAQLDNIIAKYEPLIAETGSVSTYISNAKDLRNAAIKEINVVALASSSPEMERISNKLQQSIARLQTATQSLAQEYKKANRAFSAKIDSEIDNGFSLSFSLIDDNETVQDDTYYQRILDSLQSISNLPLSNRLKAEWNRLQEKANDIDDAGFLKNFYAMSVVPFVKACKEYEALYNEYGAEYERKYSIYKENARILGIEPIDIPFSKDAITVLNEKIEVTENAIQHREEQAYISQCVDEAMREMGYEVLGNRDVVKKNGKHFHNELYLFDEGTAVNVTYANDGQITMELGGVDTEDRIPSDQECTGLADEMQSFCKDYAALEKKLQEKGIVTKRISILPPEPQYAQIINVSDFNLKTKTANYEAKKQNQQTTEQKHRRVGE